MTLNNFTLPKGENMLELIQSAFQKPHDRYCKILNIYYPGHKSAGFTERNLTCNFVFCLEQLLGESAISWFEAPIICHTPPQFRQISHVTIRKKELLGQCK
jgi:hypothetical protein